MNNRSEFTVSKLALYAYFIVMFGVKALGVVEGSKAYSIALVAGILLIVIRLVSTKYTVLECIVIGVLMALAAVSYVLSGEKGILLYLCLMVGLKEIRSRTVLKIAAFISATAFTIMTVLVLSGVKYDKIWYIQRGLLGTSTDAVIRWSFGYSHSNVCHIVFLILCAMILYFTSKDRLLINSAFLSVLNIILYFYTYSRTGVVCVFVLIVLSLYYGMRKNLGKVDTVLAVGLYPFIALFSVFLPAVIRPGRLFDIIDKVTSLRLSKAYNFVNGVAIPLFGQRLDLDFATMLDNSYLYLLGQNGLVLAVIMLLLNCITVKYLIDQDNRKALALVLVIQMAGYMEPFMYNLSFRNVAFIFYGEAFFYYLERINERINNSLLTREIRIINLDAELTGVKKLSGRINTFIKNIIDALYLRLGRTLMISMIIAIAAGAVIAYVSPWPTIVYSCDQNSANYPELITYISKSEVQEIEADDGIVINYRDEQTPVYVIPFDYGYIYYLQIFTRILGVFAAVFWVLIFGKIRYYGLMRKKL